MKNFGYLVSITTGLMLAASPALAEDYGEADDQPAYQSELGDAGFDDPGEYDYEMDDRPNLVTPMGMGFSIGGGLNDFTSNAARDFTDPGGGWEARYIIGTRSYLGGEVAYIGTANNINALGVSNDAVLLSNGAEGALRLNFTTTAFQPYVLGGVGWKHYNVVNTPTNTSDIRDSDDALVVPVGVGFAYRYQNVFADLRGNYKPVFLMDITQTGGDDDTTMHGYGANLNVGFEF